MKKAFTMIELVFVIVVIGILAAIAVPKFAVTRDDAIIVRARTTVGALRSAIATERQKRILQGNFNNITPTEAANLLEYGLGDGWSTESDGFKFTGPGGSTCKFILNNNKLTVDSSACSIAQLQNL